MGLDAFLPEPPVPATEAEIDAALRRFIDESLRNNPQFTKDQHLEYAAHYTATWLNLL